MIFRSLNYKLIKLLNTFLLLLCFFSLNLFSFEKIHNLNDVDEATISVSPKYFIYSNEIDEVKKNNDYKINNFPIIDLQGNQNIEVQIEDGTSYKIFINKGDISYDQINLKEYEKIDKKDYFKFIYTWIRSLSNFAFINCNECIIDKNGIIFNKPGSLYTYQIHNFINNKEFFNDTSYDFILSVSNLDIDYSIEANIEIAYGNNFEEKKILNLQDIEKIGKGQHQFSLGRNVISNSKTYKIQSIYFNTKNLTTYNFPLPINFHNLEIKSNYEIKKNKNDLFVKTNLDSINLKQLINNYISDDAFYKIINFQNPIKIKSEKLNYILKKRIFHQDLIEYYRNSIDDIRFDIKRLVFNKEKLKVRFSDKAKEKIYIFKDLFKLSNSDNFINIISPINFTIPTVIIDIRENNNDIRSITIHNYKTESLIPLGKSGSIHSIKLSNYDEDIITKFFDLEIINSKLIFSNNELLKTSASNEINLPKVNFEKVNIIYSHKSYKSIDLLPNFLQSILNYPIKLKFIDKNNFLDIKLECEKNFNNNNNINFFQSLYYLDQKDKSIKSIIFPIEHLSVLDSNIIFELLNDNKLYGMDFFIANLSKNSFHADCSFSLNVVTPDSNYKNSLTFPNTKKIILNNTNGFVPGYFLINDESDLYDYQILSFVPTPHKSKMPKIIYSTLLSKFIILLIFIGSIYLINNYQKNRSFSNSKLANNKLSNKFFEIIGKNIFIYPFILLIILLIFKDQILLLRNNFSNSFSLLFFIFYTFMFYIILINKFLIPSQIIRLFLLLILIILSYQISGDSYTYISILVFAYTFQVFKRFLNKFLVKYDKKHFDSDITTYLLIGFGSLICTILIHFFINIKYSDYFAVYFYYSVVMIFLHKFFISKK